MRIGWLSLLMFILAFPVYADEAMSAVAIVRSANNGQEQISAADLQRIFLGKTRYWENGQLITVVVNRDENVLDVFCRTIVHKSPGQFNMYWRRQLYTGHGMLPVQLNGDTQVVEYLTQHPEAISFVHSQLSDLRIKEIMIAP